MLEPKENRTLIFTVTSGRSGTGLLTALLRDCLRIEAEHEPEPRANFELPATISDWRHGLHWLEKTKLPYLNKHLKERIYAETSHIYCKGFIESILTLELDAKFIILSRDALSVASSLFQMGCVPERTEAAELALIGPSAPGVLPLPNWAAYTDFQLCYWYALEIERRQKFYERVFTILNRPYHRITMAGLTDWEKFNDLCTFITNSASCLRPDKNLFDKIVSVNQNPRNVAHVGNVDQRLPDNLLAQMQEIDEAVATQVADHRLDISSAPHASEEPIRLFSSHSDEGTLAFWSKVTGQWQALLKTDIDLKDASQWAPSI